MRLTTNVSNVSTSDPLPVLEAIIYPTDAVSYQRSNAGRRNGASRLTVDYLLS